MFPFARIEAPPLNHSSPDCAQRALEETTIKTGKHFFMNQPFDTLAIQRIRTGPLVPDFPAAAGALSPEPQGNLAMRSISLSFPAIAIVSSPRVLLRDSLASLITCNSCLALIQVATEAHSAKLKNRTGLCRICRSLSKPEPIPVPAHLRSWPHRPAADDLSGAPTTHKKWAAGKCS